MNLGKTLKAVSSNPLIRAPVSYHWREKGFPSPIGMCRHCAVTTHSLRTTSRQRRRRKKRRQTQRRRQHICCCT